MAKAARKWRTRGAEPLLDFGFGKGQEDFSQTGGFEFATAKFDDTAWRSPDLPHDWTGIAMTCPISVATD
jgi:hypothetical protein